MARNRLAAVDVSTGQLTTWNPNAFNIVYTLALSGSDLYAGGDFTNIGGHNWNRIAAIHTADGKASNWDANGTVRAIALGGSTVCIGGVFTNAGGQARARIAALNATVNANNVISTWNPGASELVRALAISGSNLYVGGVFSDRDGGVYNDEDDNVMNGLNNAGDLLYPNFQSSRTTIKKI